MMDEKLVNKLIDELGTIIINFQETYSYNHTLQDIFNQIGDDINDKLSNKFAELARATKNKLQMQIDKT